MICTLTKRGYEEIDRFWEIGKLTATDLRELLTDAELLVIARAMKILSAALRRRGDP